MKRTLVLKREHLADLTADELSGVAGAALNLPSGVTCPLDDCLIASQLFPCYTWLC